MKKLFITLAVVTFCSQLSFAQQIINTNTKSTCTYQGTENLQGCTDETMNCVFTFNENQKTFVHNINGVNTTYTIVSKTYQSPYWKYRISAGEGATYDLWTNQKTKEFYFSPTDLASGSTVYKYTFH